MYHHHRTLLASASAALLPRLLLLLLLLLSAAPPPSQAQEMLRFSCSKLVIERLDPLVSPGAAQSPHLHQIGGGNAFRAGMPAADFDPVGESTCTSCSFTEDFSNYWTANLFFRARNGSLARVPQFANAGLEADGGLTVYYIPPYRSTAGVTAFAPVRSFFFSFLFFFSSSSLLSFLSRYSFSFIYRFVSPIWHLILRVKKVFVFN